MRRIRFSLVQSLSVALTFSTMAIAAESLPAPKKLQPLAPAGVTKLGKTSAVKPAVSTLTDDELFDRHLVQVQGVCAPQPYCCPTAPTPCGPLMSPDQVFGPCELQTTPAAPNHGHSDLPPTPDSGNRSDPTAPAPSPLPAQEPAMDPSLSAPSFNSGAGVGAGQSQLMASNDVPAFLGDFFGAGTARTITVQPPSFVVTPDPILVTFNPGTVGVQLIPSGGTFGQSTLSLNGGGQYTISSVADSLTENAFNPVITGPATTGASVTTAIRPGDFVSNDTASAIGDLAVGDGLTLSVTGPDANLDLIPDFLEDLVTHYDQTKPGLQAQANAFATQNSVTGTGVFQPVGVETLTDQGAVAELTTDNAPTTDLTADDPISNSIANNTSVTGATPDEFGVTQVIEYDPGQWEFLPDEFTETPVAYVISIPGGNIANSPGARVGKSKLAENSSPLPRDRVFINYSYFDNTALFPGGVDVDRVTPGFEKTFFDGWSSFELRAPFASTLDSDIFVGGVTNTDNTEFGNMTFYLKNLLARTETIAISSGMGLSIPTASDVTIRDSVNDAKLIQVDNESFHCLPFLGIVGTPTNRFYYQGLLQFDIDTTKNPVSATSFDNGLPTGQLFGIGEGRDQTMMYLGLSTGYWIYENGDEDHFVTAIAPTIEYHLNQSLDHGGRVAGTAGNTDWDFGNRGTISQSNLVIGMTSVLKQDATLSVGYVAPVGGDQGFDGEVRVVFNWFFGAALNRQSRVSF